MKSLNRSQSNVERYKTLSYPPITSVQKDKALPNAVVTRLSKVLYKPGKEQATPRWIQTMMRQGKKPDEIFKRSIDRLLRTRSVRAHEEALSVLNNIGQLSGGGEVFKKIFSESGM